MVNWYQHTYDMLNEWIYGNTAAVGSYEDMILCMVSTAAVLFMVALPFIAVFAAIKRLFSWWS